MKVLVFLLLACLLQSTLCTLGLDISQLFPESTHACFKKSGFSFVIARGYCSYGGVDHNAVQSLTNAKKAGLTTHMYMFPCRGKGAAAQVDEMIKAIPANLYGTVWIDVETNPSSGCSWSGHDASSNCQFLTEILDKVKSHGKTVGIYASSYMWQTIFGSKDACHTVSSHELWYAHYDGKESFSDFTAFGGWTKPTIKQFQGDTTLCGAGVDKNYHP